MRTEVKEALQVLKNDSNFKLLLDELLASRQDVVTKMLRTNFEKPQYSQEMAFNQGRIVGIDTIFSLLAAAQNTPSDTPWKMAKRLWENKSGREEV